MKRLFAVAIFWVLTITGVQAQAVFPGTCIQPIAVGQTINGTLATTDCFFSAFGNDKYYTDGYSFSGTTGQQISIAMNSFAVDSFLDLYAGNNIAKRLASDDNGGGVVNSRIPFENGFYTLTKTGTYYIAANTAEPNQTGPYTITLTAGPAASSWPSNCIQPITLGQTIDGALTTSDCVLSIGTGRFYTDVYSFSGTAGQQISIAMSSTTVDAWLDLYDANINNPDIAPLIIDDDGGGGTNARIPAESGYHTLSRTGTYYIWATTRPTNQTGTYTITLTASGESTGVSTVVEFYHPAFDHYFITGYPEEAASLTAGNLPPWVPTGLTFNVWNGVGTNITNVCRFFSATFAPKSGHFYSNNPAECPGLQAGGVWGLEAADAFYMMPSPTGTCPSGTTPLYRLYNNGQGGAPNHRYTIDRETRSVMIAAQWIPEGNGDRGVFACALDE